MKKIVKNLPFIAEIVLIVIAMLACFVAIIAGQEFNASNLAFICICIFAASVLGAIAIGFFCEL